MTTYELVLENGGVIFWC